MRTNSSQSSNEVHVAVGDFIAVRSAKYEERPLIGQVTSTGLMMIDMDWYIGT